MGSCCQSNNESRMEKKKSKQNSIPLYKNFSHSNISSQNPSIYKNYSKKNINSQKPKPLYNKYNQHNNNNQTTSRDFYGISSQKTRAETKIDNKNFSEKYLTNLGNIYLNMITTMACKKKTIGKGGQATIRKFYSPKFKRTVVEKVINVKSEDLADQEILDAINLLKEAILLCGLNHPNIVKIYDFKSNPPTIIMEYCAKGSLRDILNKRIVLHPLYKIYPIYSICNGLNYVHSKGIVHGDLKCDNILLSDEKKYYIGRYYYPIPKLADFGLGQFHPNHVAAGTPGFIAPEIFEGSGLNFKTDIFALGMVMFEILSGLRPLPSDPEMAMRFLEKKMIPCTKEVLRRAWELRIEEFLPGVKNDYYDKFYTIMISCIADDPRKRPPISAIVIIVKKLYEIMLNVTRDLMDEESDDSFY